MGKAKDIGERANAPSSLAGKGPGDGVQPLSLTPLRAGRGPTISDRISHVRCAWQSRGNLQKLLGLVRKENLFLFYEGEKGLNDLRRKERAGMLVQVVDLRIK